MKKISSVISAILIVCTFSVGGFIGGYYFAQKEDESVIIPAAHDDIALPNEIEKIVVKESDIETKLLEISELNTYSGCYHIETYTAEFARYFDTDEDIKIFGTTNTITLKCDGIVKVGYDLCGITHSISEISKEIIFALPEPQIQDNYIKWDSVECSEKNSIFNPINFEQYKVMISDLEAEGQKQAESQGIYDASEKAIETIIKNTFACFPDYTIKFI